MHDAEPNFESFYFSSNDLESDFDGIHVLALEHDSLESLSRFDAAPRYKRAWRQQAYSQPTRQSLLPIPPPLHLAQRSTRQVKTTWPAAAVTLIRSLELEDDLRKLVGGLSVDRLDESFDARTATLASRHQLRQLFSAQAWLSRGDRLSEHSPLLQWCDQQERGNQSLAFDLALVRKSDENDHQFLPQLLNEAGRWDQMLTDYVVRTEPLANNQVLLIAKASDGVLFGYEEQALVD